MIGRQESINLKQFPCENKARPHAVFTIVRSTFRNGEKHRKERETRKAFG